MELYQDFMVLLKNTGIISGEFNEQIGPNTCSLVFPKEWTNEINNPSNREISQRKSSMEIR